METYGIVFCTCPDSATAAAIADSIVVEQLAACVNIIDNVQSVYLWQGKKETSQECLLIIKTRSELYPKLEQHIKSIHPYELPEIIMVRIDKGLPPYLAWIDDSLSLGMRFK